MLYMYSTYRVGRGLIGISGYVESKMQGVLIAGFYGSIGKARMSPSASHVVTDIVSL